jgi:phage gp16-like protein
MLAKIHVAKKQLAMDEDDYRQLLFEQTGHGSAGDCTDAQLARVIERMKAIGFRPLPRAGKKAATHPMARKARALWISLHHLTGLFIVTGKQGFS